MKKKWSKEGTIALGKEFPLINLWLQTNNALVAGAGERELGLFSAAVKGFLTPAQRKKFEAELQTLQAEVEKSRLFDPVTPAPKEWRFDALTILLKHADNAGLFDTELLGEY